MSTWGQQRQQQQQLTAEERTIAEYFADAECERKRPRNHAAYRATVLARKTSEIIEARGIVQQLTDYATPRRIIDTGPVDDYEPMLDPLLARQAWRDARDRARCEQPELLAKLRAEQARDHSWR